jgi:chromosome segregation protein
VKIKKLEIVGFKSFVDRTVVNFDHDITGIVGPNGCGKSNVVDAIKWVMGEQSAKMLRGKNMDDVIFNGSDARGAAPFAEVALTFDNTDGLTPPEYRDYAEITVSRRLDREGRSDYYINKTPVRLMDVTNLFLGTGVGRRAYSTIEQGRIGFIVSSKPEDRRHMIEEAAGITKFKARKKAAEKKMELTRANLQRVDDIVGELTRNLSSLKRQAQKAERYKEYRAEVRDLELYVASFRYLDLHTAIASVSRDLDVASAQADGAKMALRVREAELEAERAAVDKASRDVERAQTEAYGLDNQVRMIEGQVQQYLDRLRGLSEREAMAQRELGELGAQRARLRDEREELVAALDGVEEAEATTADLLDEENETLGVRRLAVEESLRTVQNARARASEAQTRIARSEAAIVGFVRRREDNAGRREKLRLEREDILVRVQEAAEERAAIAEELDRLRARKEHTSARKEQVVAELGEGKQALAELERSLSELKDRLREKRSRLRSLEELQQRFEGVGAGVRALMTKYAGQPEERVARGVLGLVSDRLSCPPELERALAGALGERLQHIVVTGTGEALAAVGYLREAAQGRATLLPREAGASLPPRAEAPSLPGLLGRLADRVAHAPEDAALVAHLLGSVVVAETLEVAIAARHAGARGFVFVTLSGDVVGADGSVTGGSAEDGGAHVLEMKREMRELEGVVEALEAELAAATAEQDALRARSGEREAELEAVRGEAHDAEIGVVALEKDHRRLEEEHARLGRRAEDLAGEEAELREALELDEDEESETRAEIEEARALENEAEDALAAAEVVYEERQAAVEAQNARVTEVRVMAAQARERAERDRNTLRRVDRELDDLEARGQRIEADLDAGVAEQGRLAGMVFVCRETLQELVAGAMRAKDQLAELRAHYDGVREAMGKNEGGLRDLRARIDAFSGEANRMALRQQELRMAMQHLLETVQERHELDVRLALVDYHARELPDASVNARIDELLKLIQRMGEINLMAIEEYEEKSERFDYLDGQRKDLLDALDQLEKAIRQMNKESRALFKEAFEAVNQRFKLVFPTLFRGGKAELKLTDAEDLLNSGVDIYAQPPGKKLGSLELMSGGEKALTAVALIFAIFQYKPSPFCILDEVDAPLDEANISRFAQAISQMTERSQFIVITHSKRTMEHADVLYGVTMEQPGISKLVAVELRGERRPAPEAPQTAAA